MKGTFSIYLVLITLLQLQAQNDPFITSWNIDANDTITIPLQAGVYDFDYTWSLISPTDTSFRIGNHTNADGDFTVILTKPGLYELEITGDFPHFAEYPKDKLLDIVQWGDIVWTSMASSFFGWPGETFTAIDTPDFSQMTSLDGTFRNASNFNDDLNHWDVSHVTTMRSTFRLAGKFNGNITDWNVSSLQSLDATFLFSAFNQDISNWNVSEVLTMSNAFRGTPFNQNISNWNVDKLRNMEGTFQAAGNFNQDLSKWNVSNVTQMKNLFRSARKFNQDLSTWDISNVTNFSRMFDDCIAFNQCLGTWQFQADANFSEMFQGADGFECQSWSSTLIGWNLMNPDLENVNIGGPNAPFDTIAAIARDELIARGWIINGTPTNGDCMASFTFPCQDSVIITQDTLFGNLIIGADQHLTLNNLTVTTPATISIFSPEVQMGSDFEIQDGIEIRFMPEAGCNLE